MYEVVDVAACPQKPGLARSMAMKGKRVIASREFEDLAAIPLDSIRGETLPHRIRSVSNDELYEVCAVCCYCCTPSKVVEMVKKADECRQCKGVVPPADHSGGIANKLAYVVTIHALLSNFFLQRESWSPHLHITHLAVVMIELNVE